MNEEKVSALRDNIQSKGSNAYYYAHGKKINGPAWDGKEEPRLLAAGGERSSITKIPTTLTDYSWLDGEKSFKLYLDFENADSIDDSNISLETTDLSLRFTFSAPNGDYVFFIPDLEKEIESATFKKKTSKFMLIVKKKEEGDWSKLKSSK